VILYRSANWHIPKVDLTVRRALREIGDKSF